VDQHLLAELGVAVDRSMTAGHHMAAPMMATASDHHVRVVMVAAGNDRVAVTPPMLRHDMAASLRDDMAMMMSVVADRLGGGDVMMTHVVVNLRQCSWGGEPEQRDDEGDQERDPALVSHL
jgi:hypothetical protein